MQDSAVETDTRGDDRRQAVGEMSPRPKERTQGPIIRDGNKSRRILYKKTSEHAAEPSPTTQVPEEAPQRNPMGIPSMYYERPTGYGPLHVTIVDREHRPIRVFANIPPLGTEISALTAVMGILLSKYLEIGGDPVRIVKHLNSVKGDRPLGFGPHRIDSVAHALGECLKEHLRRRGLMNGERHQRELFKSTPEPQQHESMPHAGSSPSNKDDAMCPQCYSRNVRFVDGCKEPTCVDCGFSNCG